MRAASRQRLQRVDALAAQMARCWQVSAQRNVRQAAKASRSSRRGEQRSDCSCAVVWSGRRVGAARARPVCARRGAGGARHRSRLHGPRRPGALDTSASLFLSPIAGHPGQQRAHPSNLHFRRRARLFVSYELDPLLLSSCRLGHASSEACFNVHSGCDERRREMLACFLPVSRLTCPFRS